MAKSSSATGILTLMIILVLATIGVYIYSIIESNNIVYEEPILVEGPQGPPGPKGYPGGNEKKGLVGDQGPPGAINPILTYNVNPNDIHFWSEGDGNYVSIFVAALPDAWSQDNHLPVNVVCTNSYQNTEISIQGLNNNNAIIVDFVQIPSAKCNADQNNFTSNYCGFDYKIIRVTQNQVGIDGYEILAGVTYLFLFILREDLHFDDATYSGYVLAKNNEFLINPNARFSILYFNPFNSVHSIEIIGNTLDYLLLTTVTVNDFNNDTYNLLNLGEAYQTSVYHSKYGPQQAITPNASSPSVLGAVGNDQSWYYVFDQDLPVLNVTVSSQPNIDPILEDIVPNLQGCQLIVRDINDTVLFQTVLNNNYTQFYQIWPVYSA